MKEIAMVLLNKVFQAQMAREDLELH